VFSSLPDFRFSPKCRRLGRIDIVHHIELASRHRRGTMVHRKNHYRAHTGLINILLMTRIRRCGATRVQCSRSILAILRTQQARAWHETVMDLVFSALITFRVHHIHHVLKKSYC
jgi:hypothetical protein